MERALRAGLLAALLVVAWPLSGHAYPEKIIRSSWIRSWGWADILARAVAQELMTRWGKS